MFSPTDVVDQVPIAKPGCNALRPEGQKFGLPHRVTTRFVQNCTLSQAGEMMSDDP
jgi:hypothetical protein